MNTNIKSFLPIIFLCFCVASFGQDFKEVALNHGITDGYGIPLYTGGGVSFVDFDGDGWDDLTYTSNFGNTLKFFRNINGTFHPMPALVYHTGEASGILWVDFDNDGDKDLYINDVLGENKLYENTGNLFMNDVTAAVGLPSHIDNSFGANFADFNNDGWLDLYVTNRDTLNYLYQNVQGVFHDVTTISALTDTIKLTWCGIWFDYDNDNYADIFLAEDKTYIANTLYRNTGNEYFENTGIAANMAVQMDAMNSAAGDYDNDGDLDVYVTNDEINGAFLFQNNGNGTFSNITNSANCGFFEEGWSANFLDYDNDGDLDLYACTRSVGATDNNLLYENMGDGTFSIPYPNGFAGDISPSYALAIGDFNNDGRPDMTTNNAFQGYTHHLWENQNTSNNNWIKILLEGRKSNRDGIGSWIEVYTNGEKQVRYTYCGEAYAGQNSNSEIIGIGQNTMVDSIKIRWQSGVVDKIENVTPNHLVKIFEDSAAVVVSTKPVFSTSTPLSIQSIFPNPATDYLTVILKNTESQKGKFLIHNMLGQLLLTKVIDLNQGYTNINLPIEKLNQGVYTLTFVQHQQQIVRTFIKQ